MKTIRYLTVIVMLMLAARCAYAQDIILLRNGSELQAKVVELTPSEIKYRRFDNPSGPLITIMRSEVFMITYENGTKEVMPEPTAVKADSEPSAPPRWLAKRPKAVGIWADPLGFAFFGPRLGVDIRRRNNAIFSPYLRFLTMGSLMHVAANFPDEMSGIGAGFVSRALFPVRTGSWNVGVMLDMGVFTGSYDSGKTSSTEERYPHMVVSSTGGYTFRFESGFYINLAAYFGVMFTFNSHWRYNNTNNSRYSDTFDYANDNILSVFGMPEVSFGIEF